MSQENNGDNRFISDDGSVKIWIEQRSSIHMRVNTSYGDPVELTSDQARLIAEYLIRFAEEIESEDI